MIKKITSNEFNNVKELVKKVFDASIAKDYNDDGKEEFYKFVNDNDKLSSLDIFGYYIEDRLIGVIGTRDEMSHISLFFVDNEFQRHSFGKKLLQTVVDASKAEVISVNSAPSAVNAYKYMGFIATDGVIETNGIKYVPMELKLSRKEKADDEYTMAELLELENKQLKLEKEEKERLAIEHQEILKLESARKKQEYIEMKERKHQEYLEMKERKHIEWLAEKERRANTFEDKTLICKKCEKEWIWTASEQKFFKEKGFFKPSMCKECRSKIKVINNFHK
ncbi:MAG: GNAT family N-acetyltransferase [Clostridia bacterium]|nr:GNAT family N-acetyltransferase [Clostridia bacterium]